MFLASPLPTTVAIPHSQSAEGAKQPSPDREVGVKAGMNGSPEGSDTNQNIPRIKLSALFFLKPTSSSANDFFTNLSVTMVLPSLSPIVSPPPGLNIILSSYPDLTVGVAVSHFELWATSISSTLGYFGVRETLYSACCRLRAKSHASRF
jgi:hypothetical protein